MSAFFIWFGFWGFEEKEILQQKILNSLLSSRNSLLSSRNISAKRIVIADVDCHCCAKTKYC